MLSGRAVEKRSDECSSDIVGASNVESGASLVEDWLQPLETAVRRFPVATLLVREHADLVRCNDAARRVLERQDGVSLRGNHVVLGHRKECQRLHEFLQLLASPSACRPDLEYGVTATRRASAHPYFLRVSRLPATRPGSMSFIARIEIFDPCPECSLDPVILRELFGLTPREIDLAQRLADGDTLSDAAAALRISSETVRSHLKQLFQKTVTSRQSQLVRLLLLTARR